MTTLTSFVADMASLSISNVERQYDHRPESIDISDGRTSFIEEMPGTDRDAEFATTCSGSGVTFSLRLYVVIDAVGQSTPSVKFAATIAAQDDLRTSLVTYESTSDMLIAFSTGGEGIDIGGTHYYSAYADITGTDL